MPYLVDSNLKRKKKQPIFIDDGTTNIEKSDVDNDIGTEWMFMEICKTGTITDRDIPEKPMVYCRYLHHGNSYLKLGPFKEEHISSRPYSVVFHDILTDIEMNFLKVCIGILKYNLQNYKFQRNMLCSILFILQEESRPNLSRNRTFNQVSGALAKHEFSSGERRRVGNYYFLILIN